MSTTLRTRNGDRSAYRHHDGNASESPACLQQALDTLRAIRQRYVIGREAHPDARFYSVQVALGSADMFWLTAAIEAVEKALGGGGTEAGEAVAQTRPET
jgi:hypothetical protein